MPVFGSPVARARACLIIAAVLWSLGSVFMRMLQAPLGLGLDSPRITAVQIAFYRGLFGGLIVLGLVHRADVRLRPVMFGMVVAFTTMSALYLSALGRGAAANAIFLQNTAPVWVYLLAVLLLGERVDRRGIQTVLLATAGAIVIVAGSWPRQESLSQHREGVLVLFMGLGSGVVYAIVVLFLRVLRDHGAAWLVTLNLLGTALTLAIFVLITEGMAGFISWVSAPSARQLAVLALFGAVQMALPYWLFARGLRSVTAPEAAIITLIEPLLNPVWAYLITPATDTPTVPMILGGSLILFALVWRYVPLNRRPVAITSDSPD
jgi:drug/metabolite transporter, DME family